VSISDLVLSTAADDAGTSGVDAPPVLDLPAVRDGVKAFLDQNGFGDKGIKVWRHRLCMQHQVTWCASTGPARAVDKAAVPGALYVEARCSISERARRCDVQRRD
jgi:hypothetical protein